MSDHQGSDPHVYGENDVFFESLSEQIDDIYRTYRAGRLSGSDTVRAALHEARRLLVAARPPSVAALTALRANIAAAQIDELLAVPPEYLDGPPAGVRLGAPTQLPPITRHEPRSPPPETLAQRLGLTRLSQVRTTLVVCLLLGAAAFAVSTLLFTPRPRARTTGGEPFGAGGEPTSTVPINNLVGRLVIVATKLDDKIVLTGSPTAGYSCEGAGGYSDIKPGSIVTVTDGGSRVIARGQLYAGKPTLVLFESKEVPACILQFDVKGVPDSGTYGIAVGHDGVFYDRQEVVEDHWSLSLTFWQ